MQRLSSARRFITLSSVLLLLCLEGGARAQSPEITVGDYCRLTESLMKLSVQEWQDRIAAVADQSNSSRESLLRKLEAVTTRHRVLKNKVYSQFGIGSRTYLHYASDHKSEIGSYLEDNPEVKTTIETLKGQINSLIEQFEAAMPKGQEGEQK